LLLKPNLVETLEREPIPRINNLKGSSPEILKKNVYFVQNVPEIFKSISVHILPRKIGRLKDKGRYRNFPRKNSMKIGMLSFTS
jgi:hypothetical protein